MTSIGDIDGDELPDLVFAAPCKHVYSSDAGAVYFVSSTTIWDYILWSFEQTSLSKIIGTTKSLVKPRKMNLGTISTQAQTSMETA